MYRKSKIVGTVPQTYITNKELYKPQRKQQVWFCFTTLQKIFAGNIWSNESLLLIEKSPEAAIQIYIRFIVALATADLEEDGKSHSWVIPLLPTAARHCLIWASVVTLQSLTLGDGSESELFHGGFRCSLVQSDAILRNTSGHCRHCLLPVFKMWINVNHIL